MWSLIALSHLLGRGGFTRGCHRRRSHNTTPNKRLHVPYQESGVATPHIQRHHHLLAVCLLVVMRHLYCTNPVFLNIWCTFLLLDRVRRMRFLFFWINFEYVNTMLVLFHAVWYVITKLSVPAWQKEARDIAYQVVQAMKEAKKDETAV